MEKVLNFTGAFLLQRLKDYFILAKPKIMYLVLFTAFTAMLLSAESAESFNILSVVVGLFCIALGSGGAGMINMWYDSDIDKIMQRTQKRPIPQGRVEKKEALFIGFSLSFLSIFAMCFFVNVISAILLAFAIFYYSFIYTILLKRSTPQNIVIGGGAGALPPIIGWAAVTGQVSLESIILFLIIFLWTPPHFWALSLSNIEDYKNANIPMLPVVSGIQSTKKQIIIYSVLLTIVSFSPYFLGFVSIVYLFGALILNAMLLFYAFHTYRKIEKCMNLFYFSIIYLFSLFSIIIIDRLFSMVFL